MSLCISLLLQTAVLIKVLCTRLSVKNALISYWNDFSLIPFGRVCFLEESYEIMQKKISNFDNSALYSTSGSMPLTLISLFTWGWNSGREVGWGDWHSHWKVVGSSPLGLSFSAPLVIVVAWRPTISSPLQL